MSVPGPFQRLFDFLDRLERLRIAYRLRKSRPRMILVYVIVPGERWEVEFGEDGTIDVEVFSSRGVEGEEKLEDLFREHTV